jgi:hypothetical protein
VAERISKLKKKSSDISIRTHGLLACGIAPQPPAPPHEMTPNTSSISTAFEI